MSEPVGRGGPIGCMVVDDHAAVRAGVRMILESEPGFLVLGEASSGEAAVAMAARRRPDVIVMDVQMGAGIDGFEASRQVLAADGDASIVLFTAYGERGMLAQGLDCGARGYLLKDAQPAQVVRAVRAVAAGGAFVDPSLSSELVTGQSMRQLTGLSDRECEILALLADGLTNAEIAQRLFLSPETVRTHVRNAMRKLDADTRTQAVALAIRERLID